MKKTAPKPAPPAPRFELATEADATPRPRGRPKKRGRPPKSARQAPPEQTTGPVQESRDVASTLAAILPEPDPVIHALLSEMLDAAAALQAEAQNNGAVSDAMNGPAGANLKKSAARLATTMLPMLPEIDPRLASSVALLFSARAFAGAVKATPARQLRAPKSTTPPVGPENVGPQMGAAVSRDVDAEHEKNGREVADIMANTRTTPPSTPVMAGFSVTEDAAATLAAEGGAVA